MDELRDETATQGVPYAPQEFAWARIRPPAHRVPVPHVSQRIRYRHQYWGPVVDAVVVSVPDLDHPPTFAEISATGELDQNVWDLLRDNATGALLTDGFGAPRPVLLPDPWPMIVVRAQGVPGLVSTREARLRGAPGWLPLDWRSRWRPGPQHGWPETGRGVLLPQGLAPTGLEVAR